MDLIMNIKGKVKFPITLDVGAWIFDDRRIDLDTYFNHSIDENEEEEELTIASKHWDRVIKEGSVAPPTLKTERKYEKIKMLTGTFGIIFRPFLHNSEPLEDATTLIFETDKGEFSLPLEQGYDVIIQFSKEGKPLREDGPVHILFPDGSNRDNPIKHVKGFRVE
ncbi:MAG TPA: peptidyl-prolyl cis-trans isomerase [Bacillaceae bacterium]|nr:peptidyl-prolyl cis-trans isomerase [Paenibacillus bovis]HLU23387.1 peptidyl-prolyl cis-trans isomerase [Bacillaceae bacterium]